MTPLSCQRFPAPSLRQAYRESHLKRDTPGHSFWAQSWRENWPLEVLHKRPQAEMQPVCPEGRGSSTVTSARNPDAACSQSFAQLRRVWLRTVRYWDYEWCSTGSSTHGEGGPLKNRDALVAVATAASHVHFRTERNKTLLLSRYKPCFHVSFKTRLRDSSVFPVF